MNPNTRSVLSSWFSSEERPATAAAGHHQEAPDYVYAPMHPTLAKKMEKRGAGRGRGAPYGSKPAPRSAGPSPIRPSASSTSGRPARALDDGEVAVARGPRRQLRSSHDGGLQDDHQRGHQNPDAIKAGRNYNTEAFDYNGSSVSGAEAPFWRAARSLPSSASSTPKKPFQPPRQRRSRFKEHLSPEEVEQGLKDGSLLQGVLRVNHKRMRLAYVSVEGFDKDVLIDGVFARNRAFEGDVVVIRLNDPSEWEVVKDDKDDEEDEAEPLGDDDDELDEDLIKPSALDDSAVDVMTDTDDEVPESDIVSTKSDAESCTATTATEKATTAESVPVLDGKVPDYEEAMDSEQATSSSRGWWQPSAATAEVAVEVESGATTTAAVESTVPVVVSSSQPTTPRAKGKRCWKCQEVGHISRDCTNPKSAQTPVKKEKKEKPHGTKEEKPAKQPVEIKEGEETKLRRTAKVVAIVKPNHVEEMVGYLKPCGLAEEELGRGNFYAFFVPLEKRMPRILVPVKRLSASIINHPNELTTNLFVCKLTGWPASSGHPRGELIKNMGPSGDMEVELRVLLQDNNIDWEDSFAPEVVACLPRIPPAPARWEIPAEEFITRKDLRKERIFTIDPATAKDMDDAVSCKRLPDGTYLVGVHIADVTYFVKPNTPLDEDAKMRATTVYMVHRSIPMLPRLLSDNMCSLVPGEDRLSFSVTWKMDKEGNVLEEPWFGRTIIRSCVKMSYEAAQEMLDDRFTPPSAEPPAPEEAAAKPVVKRGSVFAKDPTAPEHTVEEIIDDVKVLNAMAESLRKKRFEDGSLTLDDAKMYFCLDDDKMPIDVGVYVRTASHFLIEEFMLLANKSVAKRIHSAFPDRALLRRHPAPNDNKLAEFISMCSANSISFDTSSSKGFQRSLLALNSLPNPDIAAVVTRLAMKPMSVAKYTCTDEEAGEGAYKHYALAFDHYTHFTSPIRRYADVIVHRLLDACLQGLPAPLEKEELSDICDNCNMRKTKADKAQDKCDLVFLCTLLKNHPPKDLEATVITVNSRSFEVYVPLYGVEKLARAEDLPLAKLDHDKKNQALYLHWRAAANGASSTAAEEEATAGKKAIVQEIKPFTRLRVRLYPDLQRRPIDVRLAIVPPEGAAVPDNYYDAPVQESAKPKTPAKQHGRRQQNHQKPPRPGHLESAAENHDNHVENWINEARDDEAMQRQQITDRIKLFLADPAQTKLHLPAELTSFERLIAHEVAEDHGLHHQSSNYFCSETGTKERRLTLFKQAPPAAARARSRSVPGAEPSAPGVKTPTRTGAKRAAKPKLPTRAAPAEGGSVDGEPHADGTRTTPKKRPARKTKEAAKERAAAVEAEVGEDGAPVEVRTKVHRPKRMPKKRPVPATTVAPAEQQQGQQPQQLPPQEAA